MAKAPIEQDEGGRYLTRELTERQFNALFNKIGASQRKARRDAKRTLRPGALTRASAAELARLGNKPGGEAFTKDDLKEFKTARDKLRKRRGPLAGIRYSELVIGSSRVRIKRANNQVDDGSGITGARLLSIKANLVTVRVSASRESKKQEHRVRIRLDEWDDYLMDASPANQAGYLKATKEACKARVSIDCDCEDHQYRYRYIATAGNYCVAPPKEFAFPKIRNPKLKGVACKHVLKAGAMMQSVAWQRLLAREMQKQAARNGFGDDKATNKVFDGDDAKAAAKNRAGPISVDKLREEFRKYQQRQQSLGKKLKKDAGLVDKLRKELTRTRKQLKDNERKAAAINKQAKALARDKVKLQLTSFIDAFKLIGKNTDEALTAFSDKNGVPIETLRKLL